MNKSRVQLAILACGVAVACTSASADVICVKKRAKTNAQGRIALGRSIRLATGTDSCPSGFNALVDTTDFAGEPGADGSLRIYGDGSAGAKVFSASDTFSDTNTQYTDFTVDSGVVLTVPSGVTIRCTGTFTNNGSIVVATSASGGVLDSQATTAGHTPLITPAHPGVALRAAGSGEVGSNATILYGGVAGRGVSAVSAQSILAPGPLGGGGGGAGYGVGGGLGGSGGGTIRVLCQGGIINGTGASVTASGATPTFFPSDRGGGGGGGIIILASPGTITNSGTLAANGGNGAPSTSVIGHSTA